MALELFWSRGYHATSMREIALAAGVQPASLYHHFGSKEALLEDLMTTFMDWLRGEVMHAVARATTPEERLGNAVRAHVLCHGRDQHGAIVADTELRGLGSERLERVIALRDSYEWIFRQLVIDGVKQRAFSVSDPNLATKALLLLCTGVAMWYREGGRLALDEVADVHVELALAMLGAGHQGTRA